MDNFKISGVDIPFWDLVVLLIRLAIAAVPAAIILGLLGLFGAGFVAMIMAALQ